MSEWQERAEQAFTKLQLFDRDYGEMLITMTYLFVNASGEIVGELDTPDSEARVYLRLDPTNPVAKCDCGASSPRHYCVHIQVFANELLLDLDDDDSYLSSLIIRKRFNPGSPNLVRFATDPGEKTLALLDSFAKYSIPMLPPSGELPDLEQAPVARRLVWSIETTDGKLKVHPLLQTMKKTGKGFSKGKKLPSRTLKFDHLDILTPLDLKVLRTADESMYDWNPFSLQAISKLVNAPNVEIDERPGKIQNRMFYLSVTEQDDSLSFSLTGETDSLSGMKYYFTPHGLFVYDSYYPMIYVAQLTSSQRDVIEHLLAQPPIPIQYKENLLSRLYALQKNLPVVLPEEIAGPKQRDPGNMLLLLRSRADGQLDFGVRVRTRSGAMTYPGSQPAITSGVLEGKPVQWVRSTDEELQKAEALCASLGIKPSGEAPFTGTISELNDALMFLENLELHRKEIEVLWDNKSAKAPKFIGSISASQLRIDVSSKRNWFGIGGECQVGDENLTLQRLLEKLDGTTNPLLGDYTQIGEGEWVRIEQSLRENLLQLKGACHTDRKSLIMDGSAAPVLESLDGMGIQLKATKAWQECMQKMLRAQQLDPPLPDGFSTLMRDYQTEGFKWMSRLAEWGIGGVLADDMGLGKTIQTLAVLASRAAEGPTLVLAPTSVGFNWIRETKRFAPSLTPIMYRESDRRELLENLKHGDLVVSSYAIALRDGSELAKVQWGTLVMDEAQAIKNARSKTSQTVSTLNAKWTIALTGTPMENHLGELWSLFSVVAPGVLGGWESFRTKYAAPIEKNGCERSKRLLADRLKPFILRRTKEQVLQELPPRTESVLYVDLSPAERSQYELVRRTAIGELQNLVTLPDQKDQRFKILSLLTRLRQFACHPGIVNKKWDRSSAKLDQLCETLTNLREEGHRALVFSQFTEHLGLIRKALDEQGISYEYLDGSTPAAERQRLVDAFQNGNSTAFLISLKAGGTGLNLTAADYVIHMDPWWNPAVEDQATDRAHRFGQDKPVMVYRIVAKDTIEEEILAMHDTKRDLVESVLDGTGAAGKLSTQDLVSLIQGNG
ncbi:DEAD/DEAH box helicase [Pirellula sp. SH-Sr6A]|uniref:DEAD/DEAH box helicase n=1 Tax=Pirellula sp. SH-Sr6A TaxID=1632865 RepID=UPI00197C66D1|nr:DEAD/DEAH box helicase [Pirellula sp. SH-Sr6A]